MSFNASTNIMLFMLLMSLTVGFGETTGYWDDMGATVDTGLSDAVEDAKQSFKKVSVGGLGLSSLIGLPLLVFDTLKVAFNLVTAAPDAIGHILGGQVGSWIAISTEVLFIILAGRDMLASGTQRDI